MATDPTVIPSASAVACLADDLKRTLAAIKRNKDWRAMPVVHLRATFDAVLGDAPKDARKAVGDAIDRAEKVWAQVLPHGEAIYVDVPGVLTRCALDLAAMLVDAIDEARV